MLVLLGVLGTKHTALRGSSGHADFSLISCKSLCFVPEMLWTCLEMSKSHSRDLAKPWGWGCCWGGLCLQQRLLPPILKATSVSLER